MRDQYSFLKSIDASSSSPELVGEEEAAAVERQREIARKRLQDISTTATNKSSSNGQTTGTSSSSINSRTPGGGLGLKSKIQNLVKPISKFHYDKQQQQQVKEDKRHEETRHERFASPLTSNNNNNSKSSSSKVCDSGKLSRAMMINQQRPAQALKATATSRRHHHQQQQHHLPTASGRLVAPNLNGSRTNHEHHHPHHHHPPPHYPLTTTKAPQQQQQQQGQNKLLTSSETNSAATTASTHPQQEPAAPELAKCYDEIDQIYDYIRGLAPLPANLRKIKSIDFEQLERERLRMAEQQQLQQQRQVQHHQHRQRYVRSIHDSPGHSAGGSSSSPPSQRATALGKRLVKARQRQADCELEGARLTPLPPPSAKAAYLAAPMPIRVTARSGESHRPSIKRVESLNLGQRLEHEQQPRRPVVDPINLNKITQAKLTSSKPIQITNTSKQLASAAAVATLTKPSYLISTTQRGQVFRLPRAHSTSTLNKPISSLNQTSSGVKNPHHHYQPVIQENLPLVARLSTAAPHTTGSLGRSVATPRYKKRFSFESDLVESFVDDDDDDDRRREVRARAQLQEMRRRSEPEKSLPSSNSSPSSESESSPSGSSSSLEEDLGQEEDDDDEREEDLANQAPVPASSERLSQKSHSDYDNDDSDETNSSSETTATTTTSQESNTNSAEDEEGESEQQVANDKITAKNSKHRRHQKASSSSMSPFMSGGSNSTSKRSQRPTTSSSPSSGRPASPADDDESDNEQDNDDDGQPLKSVPLSYRQLLPRVQTVATSAPFREEHIYEQIPAHKSLEPQQQQPPLTSSRRMSDLTAASTTIPKKRSLAADQAIGARAPIGGSLPHRGQPPPSSAHIKHPVAYAANVAVNRRYQQQVAALFALQQQRDRQLTATATTTGSRRQSAALISPPLPQPPTLPAHYHSHHHHLGEHQRRASSGAAAHLLAGVPQSWRPQAAAPATSRNNDHHHHSHHSRQRQVADVPHRHRLSMGNIHLLTSAIPLASLYSPKQPDGGKSGSHMMMVQMMKTPAKERRRSQNTNSLDDSHEAGSTGTTNSTSSYEAAIKNSEPNPLKLEAQQQLDVETRQSSGRRSVGSGSGTRSLTNHLLSQTHNSTSHTLQQHQPSSLVKVPKLSKQSHLLQRPLPNPPNHHRSSNSTSTTSKHPVVKPTSSSQRVHLRTAPVVDVL